MDWIRNNRFLSGYLAVLVLGIGVLSFLVYSSYGRYSQVSDDYHTQVTELKRLENLTPYPEAANLQRYQEVKQNYAAAVTDLQRQLAGFEPAPESPPPTPLQFQDRLRRVVEEVSNSAQQAGVGLPEGFYLGFEQYRGAPPDTAATPGLSAELDAIRDLVDILIKQHIDKLTAIARAPLPQEAGNSGGAPAGPPRPGRGGLGAGAGAPELVTHNAVQIEFTGLPNVFRETLNKITSAPRLYIVSALRVKNDVDKGPTRGGGDQINGGSGGPGGPARPGGPPQPPPPSPGQAPDAAPPAPDQNGVPPPPLPEKGPPPLRYVVGLEKVSAVVRIELAKVAPPR